MAIPERPTPQRRRLPAAFYNGLSFAGALLAAATLGLMAFLIVLDLLSSENHPYMGMIVFAILPVFLILGLLLVAAGVVRQIRQRRRGVAAEARLPLIDLDNPRHRRLFLIVASGSVLFAALSAFGTYQAYEFTNSNVFCGTMCHSVMHPEWTAYQQSPHSRVKCADCHIGSGARWAVRAKLTGAHQIYAVLFNTYDRPIPTPVHNLRPSRDTCEQCHWPAYFFHQKLVVRDYYVQDEAQTHVRLHLLLDIGGGEPGSGLTSGIHWHMNLANQIEYFATDERRQQIPWVRSRGSDGSVKVYVDQTADFSAANVDEAAVRRMDCIDCHNRPTHRYHPPQQEVNLSLAEGRMDPTLPELKATAVAALEKEWATTQEARAGIEKELRDFYQNDHSELAKSRDGAIATAITETQRIYQGNYFPEMKVSWRGFPDNVGHLWSPGCFRCHDGNHVSEDGSVISRDCNVCHTLLSQQTGADEHAALRGVEFQHPVDIGDAWKTTRCSDCHGG